jgi:hypothetical protein
MRSLFIPVALLAVGTVLADDWTPPDNPIPGRILDEAESDAANGRHKDALAKHVWFHRNALERAPAMYGVRLSFALSSWKELADEYPPALDAMKRVRDEAKTAILDGKAARRNFHDLSALNE